jgi:alpha,alpha-trehalose phosphorylase
VLHGVPIERPGYVYPPEPWRLVERRFYPRLLGQSETLFATGNGYLGMRGCFEENTPVVQSGTFINGFYESWPIVYPEEAFGFARTGQTIVDVTDSSIIRLFIDDEPFELPTVEIEHFERALDMQNGRLDREVVWVTPSGKRARLRSRRVVSFAQRHLALIEYELTLLDAPAPVDIASELSLPAGATVAPSDDPRKSRALGERVLWPVEQTSRDLRLILCHRTDHSRLMLACGVDHRLETGCTYTYRTRCKGDEASITFSIDAEPQRPIRLLKFISYHHDRTDSAEDLKARTHRTLDRAIRHGARQIQDEQRAYLDDFWAASDFEIGHVAIQQAVRFNLFHILQASARAEVTGVPAKGLTGHGYEGHYFWDTEIYLLPFLIYTQPQIARNLLMFRYRCLDQARQRARDVNQKGALFPWRTISGEEASAYYAAGTAQYHINADIAYAIRKYVAATGDVEFLHGPGVEILVETARLWCDLGFFSDRHEGRFCIAGVTGPDEYNTVVNNNTFTNLMARENLRYAASTVAALRDGSPDDYEALRDATDLDPDEIEEWQRAGDAMYLPMDEAHGIHLQDDDFLDRRPWDFAGTRPEQYPLLLHYHPLVIYRHQVIKQADVVLAMFLLRDAFRTDEVKRNYDFYDPLTTGDSSLSVCIQAIVAADLGYLDRARLYARHAVLMDLADVAGNVTDGCHIASMGGTWMVMAYGLAGFRDHDGIYSFRPLPPREFESARFRLRFGDRLLELRIGQTQVVYALLEGERFEFRHRRESITLTRDAPEASRPVERTERQPPPGEPASRV